MADLTYNVDVNTTQAQNSLQKLQTTVSGTQAAFAKLNTVSQDFTSLYKQLRNSIQLF